MNENTKKTIAGIIMALPEIYLAEGLILGHPSEPHAAEKIVDTTPVLTQHMTLSGSVTPSNGPVKFVYHEQNPYNQAA